MIGETVSHYRIVEELGGGGMGVVYRAEDTHLGRDVALKFLPPELTRDAEARERFALEARAASALDHANICTIFDIDETEDGRLFIAMAFYGGQTLRARLADGPLPVDEAMDLARQIAAGLQRAHESGIVHRDIKPANVMITTRGEAKIVDFGIAKLAGEAKLTRTGSTLGTLSYMAPEQAEGKEVGPATDIWALGVVLHEMLTGTPPFDGGSEAETIAAILARDAGAPGSSRDGVPTGLDELVLEMLQKDPGARPETAGGVAAELDALRRPAAVGADVPLLRRPTTWIGAAATVILVITAIAIPVRGRARVDAARALLPRIESLAGESRFAEAYALAVEAERVVPDDSTLLVLLQEVSDVLHIRTTPPGANVHLLAFDDETGTGVRLGETPIENLRLARGDFFVAIESDGYRPVERVVSTQLARVESVVPWPGFFTVDIDLLPADSVPEEMVHVPAGEYTLISADAPAGASADLPSYMIDRFEVTNADFGEFIRAGGYESDELAGLRDRTGLHGPREWTGQQFPDGAGRHPVSSVTWYEASAYCAWRGKDLPTLFEWEKAARGGAITHYEGTVLPWGLVGPGQTTERRANYSGGGPVDVDAHPFGVSPFGAYGMAGNVREWTASSAEEGFIAMGGSWLDPSYVFSAIATPSPDFASPGLGFRCVRRDPTSTEGLEPIELARRSPTYEPVDEATYRRYLDHYRYDPVDPGAEILATEEAEDWTRHRIAFNGDDDSRILAYLHLPRGATPPYQTLVFVPGVGAFVSEPAAAEVEWLLGPTIRSGRAVLTVVLDGMVERPWPPGTPFPGSNTVEFRNLMVRHVTELSRGVDYLETRDDIDLDRLAYAGLSFGAGSRSVLAAIDDRWKAVIFVGAGIDERVHPTVPEALNVNFLPYITQPKLVVNGRQDEEHPWLTRALPFWNLLSEPKELVLADDEGHVPSLEVRVPAINDFLDRHFGPVR